VNHWIIIRTFGGRISMRNPEAFSDWTLLNHFFGLKPWGQPVGVSLTDKVRPWSKRKRSETSHVPRWTISFGAGFWSIHRHILWNLDPRALSDGTSLSAAEFCWPVSFGHTIHGDKEGTCLWVMLSLLSKSVVWLLNGLKIEQDAWFVGLSVQAFAPYAMDKRHSCKRIWSNLVMACTPMHLEL
jgi:hypothetical protein